MKKKLKVLFMIVVSLFCILGCKHTANQEEADQEYRMENPEDLFNDSIPQQELGSYSFGPLLDVEMDERILFEYNGEEIKIPYHVEGHGEGVVSELGWFAFVDGLPQPTRLETAEGEVFREMAYIHEFELEFLERQEFYVVFTPVSGTVGERVSFIAGGLLRPNFIPESRDQPNFGVYHNLVATIPAEIQINQELSNTYTSYGTIQLEDIPQEMIDQEQIDIPEGEDIFNVLEQNLRIGILPNEESLQLNYNGFITADNGRASLQLFLYGGLEVTSRITLFVNHRPIQIEGTDFIEVQMERGKIAVVELELELDELEKFNSLYAIAMTTGDDYYLQDIFKTHTLLLVNE